MIVLRKFATRPEAEVIKSILGENGIPSLVQADDQGGMQPALAFVQGVRLWVQEKDFARAKALLENIEGEAE